jgi:hypothetical protein
MSIFSGIEQFGSLVSGKINSAFDSLNHGFLDGNFDDFQLCLNRVVGIVPNIIANKKGIVTKGTKQGFKNILDPLTYSPSFYIIANGSIIALLIVGYSVYKVRKYI